MGLRKTKKVRRDFGGSVFFSGKVKMGTVYYDFSFSIVVRVLWICLGLCGAIAR